MKDKPNKILLTLLIIAILLLGGLSIYTNKLRTDYLVSEQNVSALNDSIRTTTNKLGDVELAKKILIADKKDLKKLSDNLAFELSKEKGKVHELNILVFKLKNKPADTIFIHDVIHEYGNGVYGIKWDNDTIYDEYNYRRLSGETLFKLDSNNIKKLGTKLYTDEIGFKLVTGLRKFKGNIEIFVRSDYPGFTLTQLEGSIINPDDPILKNFTKKKHWVIGPGIFVGVSGEGKIVPILGGGITFNLFSF